MTARNVGAPHGITAIVRDNDPRVLQDSITEIVLMTTWCCLNGACPKDNITDNEYWKQGAWTHYRDNAMFYNYITHAVVLILDQIERPHRMDEMDESRLDHDGENARRRAEVDVLRAETKARGGIGI